MSEHTKIKKENESEDIQRLLTNHSNYLKKFFRYSRYFFNLFVFLCVINPIIEKNLLLSIYIPGFNDIVYDFKSPIYWFFYISQIYFIYFAVISFEFSNCTFLTFIFFGTTKMKILKYKIRSLKITEKLVKKLTEPKIGKPSEKRKDLNKEIVSCIKMHIEIKGFVSF